MSVAVNEGLSHLCKILTLHIGKQQRGYCTAGDSIVKVVIMRTTSHSAIFVCAYVGSNKLTTFYPQKMVCIAHIVYRSFEFFLYGSNAWTTLRPRG